MLRASLLCAAAALASAQLDPPQQIHLAYYGSDIYVNDGMTASWVTVNPTGTSTCNFGTTPSFGSSATGNATQYLSSAKGGTWNHHVHLLGLTPATQYYYTCGDAVGGFTPTYTFTTAPAAGAAVDGTMILVYGDQGIYNSHESMLLTASMVNESAFIWHIGDISYADDAFLHDPVAFEYENTYNYYMSNLTQLGITPGKALMVEPGNHEAECHSPVCFLDSERRTSLGNFSAYRNRFRMPYELSGGTSNMWYSFRYGSVHFVQINTETDYPNAPLDEYASKNGGFGDQLGWLEADLAAAAAARAAGQVSWILAAGHRPIYSRASADAAGNPSGEAKATQLAFEPLFAKYGVDLFVCGHEHSYEGVWPVVNGTTVFPSYTNPPYTTYVVTGAAGNTEGHTGYGPTGAPWSRVVNGVDYGISTLTLHNASALTFDFRRAVDGSVFDSWTLTRQH